MYVPSEDDSPITHWAVCTKCVKAGCDGRNSIEPSEQRSEHVGTTTSDEWDPIDCDVNRPGPLHTNYVQGR